MLPTVLALTLLAQSSRARICPQCNAPLDHLQCRIVDRLVSWI
jgi:hypothetical protein